MSNFDIETIIKNRLAGLKTAHASNKIENVDMSEAEFNAMLERAKEPISDEEFAEREIKRVYAEYGIEFK